MNVYAGRQFAATDQAAPTLIAHRRARLLGAEDHIARFPRRGGHGLALLRDGPETYDAMLAAFDEARAAINLISYAFDECEAAERIADGIVRARRRGVTVRVLYDWIGSSACPSNYFKALRDSGVLTRPVRPLGAGGLRGIAAINRRNHRKLATVDGAVGFVGGVNITKSYRRGSRVLRRRVKPAEPRYADDAWRDTHLELRGPGVTDLDTIFFEDWRECGSRVRGLRPGAVDAAAVLPDERPTCWTGPDCSPSHHHGSAALRVTSTSSPDDPNNEPFAFYARALRHASRTVEITHSYFAPPRWLLHEVCAAARRGVDVRIIVPGRSDNMLALYASRTNYGRLLRAGVRLFEMQECFLHAKTMVVDGWWSIVGSANLDMRSWLHNDETCVVVYDEDFAGGMHRQFALDLAASQELSRRRWRRRGTIERIKERATLPIYHWL